MDGDPFGIAPAANAAAAAAAANTNVNTNTNASTNITVGSLSEEPSLLTFASPPPSQDASNDFDLLQQQGQQQPELPQQATENSLDFGATDLQPQTQQQTAITAPIEDLFGGMKLLSSSPNPTPNTTPQPQSQAQHLDFFGSPVPSVTMTPSLPEAAASTPDEFSPISTPVPASDSADDPFAVVMQPQAPTQEAAISDPLLALPGNLSMSAKPKPNQTAAEATTPEMSPLPAQPYPVPSTNQTKTAATTQEETKTPQKVTIGAKIDEEEKKDQNSPMVTVSLENEEETPVSIAEISGIAVSVENIENKEELSPVEVNATNEGNTSGEEPERASNKNNNNKKPSSMPADEQVKVNEEKATEVSISHSNNSSEEIEENEKTSPLVSSPNNTNPAAPEIPRPEQKTVAIRGGKETHELDLKEILPDETLSKDLATVVPVPDTAAINKNGDPIPAERNSSSSSPKQPQPQSPITKSKILSTLTKSPKFSERKAPAVANRFAGFKSMAGNIAAKGAERVAKVKDQIQKEEEDGGQTTSANRFAGFKSMAGSMAAKGAERVAKVKDQIQKEDTEGQNLNAKQRFTGFKNIAENMAAKGAERVAKVKDQIQKEDANGQNVNTKRLSGFKNIAGNIAARGAKSVASVQVPQQLASVQVPQRFNAANLSLFGKGNKAIENSTTNSSHGSKATLSAQPFPSSSSSSPESLQQTTTTATTATKIPKNPNIAPSTQIEAGSDTQSESQPKQPVTVDAQTIASTKAIGENGNETAVERNQLESNVDTPLSSPRNMMSKEEDSNANKIDETIANKSFEVDKIESDGTKSPEIVTRVESISNVEKSTATTPQNPATEINDRHKESLTPLAKDNSAKSQIEEIEGPISSITKTEIKSVKPSNVSKTLLVSNPTPPKVGAKSSPSESTASKPTAETENSDAINPAEVSNEFQPQQASSFTQNRLSPPSQEISSQVENLQRELNAAQTLIMELQHHKKNENDHPGDTVMVELQANLQKEMTRRAEAEEKARIAIAKSKRIKEDYTTFKAKSKSNLDKMTTNVESLTKGKKLMEKELVDIREERDEQARKEMALTTRLNAAKKKEAVKANAAEHYGDQVDQLELAVKEYESQVETLTAERDQLKVELGEWKEYAEKRTNQLEMALNDEKKLNAERKQKMKGFVEAKTEEVRAVKADYISLQTELDQTSHSLTELNQRYKQLHAQWIQSQTRNRELQRDAMKMKQDSEKMHKVGGSLEARLSRSAQQSEDHKNKRIHARNELMSVLGQLEAERSVNSRLQESIKMTFTPKALSQQQIIQEALDDFDAALQKLSLRIGRPLPPSFSSNDPSTFADNTSVDGGSSLGLNEANSGDDDSSKQQGTSTLFETNGNKALQKLENETQRVSQNIVKFSANVERMHSLLDGGGTKSCVDVLSQILMSGNSPAIAAATPTRKNSGQRYGQLSRNIP